MSSECDACGQDTDGTHCHDGLPGHPVPDDEITAEMTAAAAAFRRRLDLLERTGGIERTLSAADLRDGKCTVTRWHPGWIIDWRVREPCDLLGGAS